jgi:hypothetical protein
MLVCIYAPRAGEAGRPAAGEASVIVSAASEEAALTAAKADAPLGVTPADLDHWTSVVLDADGTLDEGTVLWFGDAWTLRGDRRGG